MKYKTIDLCAGIGGIRRGFELASDTKNMIAAEIDEWACKTYENIYHENPRNDVTDIKFQEKLKNLVALAKKKKNILEILVRRLVVWDYGKDLRIKQKEPFFLI